MTRHIRAALVTLWVAGALLAACSTATVQPAAPPATVAPTVEAEAEVQAEAEQPRLEVQAEAAPEAEAQAEQPAAQVETPTDWAQTVTVEGDFYVLGNPAAPVRLVDFSDFF